jgi:hypothetical protein
MGREDEQPKEPDMMATRRRDWFRILADLRRAGVKTRQIARKTGRNAGTVLNWAEEGAEPKESDARVVLALYAKHCPELYAEHQKAFEIRVEIELMADVGEQGVLV